MTIKNIIFLILAIIVAVTFTFLFGMAEYSNNEMRRQIEERDAYINYIDSFMLSQGYIVRNDSLTFFLKPLDKYGNPTTLQGYDSLRIWLERQVELQDKIIKSAKRLYGFDYSYKVEGDSVSMKFWRKPNPD